jgi:hypothetical protein
LRDDGILEVAIVRSDSSVKDLIFVRGSESHLLNDLEYARGMLLFDESSWSKQDAIRDAIERRKRPNKAPEPTSGSVTPRAIEGMVETKQWNENRSPARVAPAPAVAHL